MRGLLSLLAISLFLISSIAGCRPSGPTEEMGTVVNKMPVVEGTEEPYVIPELGPSTSDAKQGEAPTPGPVTKPAQVDKPGAVTKHASKEATKSSPAKKASPDDKSK